ncbi:hypothetical protein HK100_012168 [Physocladia obscura]|uniref:HMG box domain-containing protein n=1 Tax=Physocladia obscura TaxID=109957 RepID=A0AAD5T672_9FUNG|nr:hypothetical protein HK100_012168 [Physocladia obscura]
MDQEQEQDQLSPRDILMTLRLVLAGIIDLSERPSEIATSNLPIAKTSANQTQSQTQNSVVSEQNLSTVDLSASPLPAPLLPKPSRPASAYTLWAKQVKTNSTPQLVRFCADPDKRRIWNEMSDSEKKPFNDRYANNFIAYKIRCEAYKEQNIRLELQSILTVKKVEIKQDPVTPTRKRKARAKPKVKQELSSRSRRSASGSTKSITNSVPESPSKRAKKSVKIEAPILSTALLYYNESPAQQIPKIKSPVHQDNFLSMLELLNSPDQKTSNRVNGNSAEQSQETFTTPYPPLANFNDYIFGEVSSVAASSSPLETESVPSSSWWPNYLQGFMPTASDINAIANTNDVPEPPDVEEALIQGNTVGSGTSRETGEAKFCEWMQGFMLNNEKVNNADGSRSVSEYNGFLQCEIEKVKSGVKRENFMDD